jgi:NitT/TauT family transport system substrate-binding protein
VEYRTNVLILFHTHLFFKKCDLLSRNSRIYISVIIIFAILIVSAGIYWFTLPKTPYDVKLASPSLTYFQNLLVLGVEKGIFADEGLNVTIWVSRTGQTAVQSMIAGESEFNTATSSSIEAGLRGADIKIVAGTSASPNIDLVARPDIGVKSVADLKGKTIAVKKQGNIDDFILTTILAKNGLVPNKDVQIMYYGADFSTAAAMMENKAVDAAMLDTPINRILTWQKGYVLLATSSEYVPLYQAGALVTTSKVIAEKPEVVKKTVMALAKTIQFMKQNREATVEFYLRQYPTLLDRTTAEQLYDIYYNGWDYKLNVESVKYTVALQASILGLSDYPPAEQLVDTSFVDEVTRELGQEIT